MYGTKANVRVLVLSTALLSVAACALPQRQQANTAVPTATVAAMPPASLRPAAVPPQPLVAGAMMSAPTFALPPPAPASPAPPPLPTLLWRGPLLNPAMIFAAVLAPPGQNRLTLSNFSLAEADVEAVVATQSDCASSDRNGDIRDFILPLNGTRVIMAPPKADVCWRYELPRSPDAKSGALRWSGWRRAYFGRRQPIDSTI